MLRGVEQVNNKNRGFISVDINGIITYINGTAEAITGWYSSTALGQHIKDILRVIRPVKDSNASSLFDTHLEGCSSSGLEEFITVTSKNGFVRHIRINVSIIKDCENRNTGMVIVIENI